jgi:hypothetical protein
MPQLLVLMLVHVHLVQALMCGSQLEMPLLSSHGFPEVKGILSEDP